MNYTLFTGHYLPNAPIDDFHAIWVEAIDRYVDPAPNRVVVLSVGDSWTRAHEDRIIAPMRFLHDVVDMTGNLGHVHDLLDRKKPYAFCGWSMAFLTGCMIAYMNETDALFLEQDCLAFGPWVERAYRDMGSGDMVFGGPMKSAPYMPTAQALVLVRHEFIPQMVAAYLKMGTDANPVNLPEHKFQKLQRHFGTRIRHLSFGVDRERPIPYDAEVFYVQKLAPDELAELKRRGLI